MATFPDIRFPGSIDDFSPPTYDCLVVSIRRLVAASDGGDDGVRVLGPAEGACAAPGSIRCSIRCRGHAQNR
jgi:hypothetical protein